MDRSTALLRCSDRRPEKITERYLPENEDIITDIKNLLKLQKEQICILKKYPTNEGDMVLFRWLMNTGSNHYRATLVLTRLDGVVKCLRRYDSYAKKLLFPELLRLPHSVYL